MYVVFIICFLLRLLILGLDGALIDGRMLVTTFANSIFISTSGIGLYEVIKKGREIGVFCYFIGIIYFFRYKVTHLVNMHIVAIWFRFDFS